MCVFDNRGVIEMGKGDSYTILGIDPGTNLMGYGLLSVKGNSAKLLAMGVLDLRKMDDHYTKLNKIFLRVLSLIDEFDPQVLSIESPFFGKNVQSMLKLGRAQGVAMSAALYREVPVHEYTPLKIKMAISGNGRASKEQIAALLQRYLCIPQEQMLPYLDATDALAAAYCHFLQIGNPVVAPEYKSWKDFMTKHPGRVSG